jgi:hypothetical protein
MALDHWVLNFTGGLFLNVVVGDLDKLKLTLEMRINARSLFT